MADVCKYLRKHLNWVQNSVFEGELTKAQLERVKVGLDEIIKREKDSIYIYQVQSKKWLEREVMGTEKSPTSPFI